MEEKKTLSFGKRYRVGNFQVIKINKVLRRQEVAELRNQLGIPMEERKKLQRAQLPFIKVEAVSGVWAVEFSCATSMYRFIDILLARAIEAEENGERLDINSVADFAHIFSMMFTDTTILGDGQYLADKGKALRGLLDRQNAEDVSQEDDDKELDQMEADEEAKANIIDMAGQIGKEAGDEGK